MAKTTVTVVSTIAEDECNTSKNIWSKQASLQFELIRRKDLCDALSNRTLGTAITACIIAWLLIGHHSTRLVFTRAESEGRRGSVSSVPGHSQGLGAHADAWQITTDAACSLHHPQPTNSDLGVKSCSRLWGSKNQLLKSGNKGSPAQGGYVVMCMWLMVGSPSTLVKSTLSELEDASSNAAPHTPDGELYFGRWCDVRSSGKTHLINRISMPTEQHHTLCTTLMYCHMMGEQQQEKGSWLCRLSALMWHSSHTV